jgi:hypothetical protein
MRPLIWLIVLGAPLLAQSSFRKNNVFVGGGGGVPAGELRPFLAASPVLRFGYGYRFHPNFQADTGMDIVFHAAKIRDFYESRFGDLRIKDYQYLVPFGGRTILPLGRRLQFHAGAGGAYLRYSERIRQPFGDSGIRIDCPVCRSRSGWGGYGLLGASFALDRYQQFRLGFTTRVFRANTSGDAFGPLPAQQTADQWVNSAVEFNIVF